MFLLSFKGFLEGYEVILENIASFAVITLEMIGIIVIIVNTSPFFVVSWKKKIIKRALVKIKLDLSIGAILLMFPKETAL